MKTYLEFVSGGKNMRFTDMDSPLNGVTDEEFGRIYEKDCYIGLMENGKWHLVIGLDEWEDWDIRKLEDRLYRFYAENWQNME